MPPLLLFPPGNEEEEEKKERQTTALSQNKHKKRQQPSKAMAVQVRGCLKDLTRATCQPLHLVAGHCLSKITLLLLGSGGG